MTLALWFPPTKDTIIFFTWCLYQSLLSTELCLEAYRRSRIFWCQNKPTSVKECRFLWLWVFFKASSWKSACCVTCYHQRSLFSQRLWWLWFKTLLNYGHTHLLTHHDRYLERFRYSRIWNFFHYQFCITVDSISSLSRILWKRMRVRHSWGLFKGFQGGRIDLENTFCSHNVAIILREVISMTYIYNHLTNTRITML